MTSPTNEALLEGRMPILPSERLFRSGGAFTASCVVYGAAIWIFMIGASLAALGDVRYATSGYMAGLIVGFVPVLLSTGIPCFRYGIDPMDAAKATFGTRGVVFPLLGLVYCALAWCTVVAALIVRGAAELLTSTPNVEPASWMYPALALVVAGSAWGLVKSGPGRLERVNNVIAPALLLISISLLTLLVARHGWSDVWNTRVSAGGWMFHDRQMTLTQAVEQGVGTSLGSWPFIGGLTRLVARRRDVVTPSMVGVNVIGLGFGSGVAALVAHTLASGDPVDWFLQLGGGRFGLAIALGVLVSNVAVIALFVYFAAMAAQQVRAIRRMKWEATVAILLVPVALGSCFPATILASVLAINSYQGMVFVGICGVALVHYLRNAGQHIHLRSVLGGPGEGRYVYRRGFNVRALVCAAAGSAAFRCFLDPTSLRPGPGFALFGASLPALFVSMALYAVLGKVHASTGRPVSDPLPPAVDCRA